MAMSSYEVVGEPSSSTVLTGCRCASLRWASATRMALSGTRSAPATMPTARRWMSGDARGCAPRRRTWARSRATRCGLVAWTRFRWPDADDPAFYEGMDASFEPGAGKYVVTNIFMLLFERMHSLHGFENTLADLYLSASASRCWPIASSSLTWASCATSRAVSRDASTASPSPTTGARSWRRSSTPACGMSSSSRATSASSTPRTARLARVDALVRQGQRHHREPDRHWPGCDQPATASRPWRDPTFSQERHRLRQGHGRCGQRHAAGRSQESGWL